MKKIVVSNKLIKEINANYKKSNDFGKQAVLYAIKVGDGLIEAQKEAGFGNWENWLKETSNRQLAFRFETTRQTLKDYLV